MKALILVAALAAAAPAVVHAQYGGYGTPGGYGAPSTPGIYGAPGGYGSGSNPSSHNVEGYTRQNGAYVAPHYETNPNSTQMDNYSTRGNYNPNTGTYGTRAPR